MTCCDGEMMGSISSLMWVWMILTALAFVGLIVAGLWLLVGALNRANAVRIEDHAFSTLRDRYARGEIDELEYRARRDVLDRDATSQ